MSTRPDAAPSKPNGGDLFQHKPGDVVAGKYLLRQVIGAGGMGTVWGATNVDLGLDVAVKLVNDGLDAEETRARLGTEARAEAKVQHRGIVRVLDLGVTEQGEPFLVMEQLEGRSLGDLLCDTGAIPAKDAVRLMLPVIEALSYVHERGIVHRDLKPDNIFLSQQCGRIQPKLLDFGIAKIKDMPAEHRRTGRGAVVGSPGYMAPEHARGVDVDHRADIFTAALVLYETITGRQAFRATNYNALLREVIERQLEPIVKLGLGDAALSRIIERGLKKDPARRYASCEEFGRALATWLLSLGEVDDVTGEPLNSWWRNAPSAQTEAGMGSSAALKRRISSGSGRPGIKTPAGGTIHGVSLSTSGFTPPRPLRRKVAFVALALSGFAGGLLATRASAFFPDHGAAAPTPHVAAAATSPSPSGPTVTPVAEPTELSVASHEKTVAAVMHHEEAVRAPRRPAVTRVTRPTVVAAATTPPRTPEPEAVNPPSTNPYSNPLPETPHTLALASLERQARDEVAREMPPAPPAPDDSSLKVPARSGDQTELKDPYP